jgi:hypothetical protein
MQYAAGKIGAKWISCLQSLIKIPAEFDGRYSCPS